MCDRMAGRSAGSVGELLDMESDQLPPVRLSCKRCGHQWKRRRVSLPVACPKCHSPYWDKDRVYVLKPKTD